MKTWRFRLLENPLSMNRSLVIGFYGRSAGAVPGAYWLEKGEFKKADGGFSPVPPVLEIPEDEMPAFCEAIVQEMIRLGKMLPSSKEIERLEKHLADIREMGMKALDKV